jgi:tRNA threonylcarbamoyladenosine biosynthesis protein TsaE
MTSLITKNSQETFALGKALASLLESNSLLALSGDLGAGKTCLTQGLAEGLGIKNKVNSPTFVVMKVYETKKNKNIKLLCHIDAYRLTGPQDLISIGFSDYLKKEKTITVIEWAEKIKKILPKNTILIDISHIKGKENERRITIKRK